MLENGDFDTQVMLYQHGVWVLIADMVRKADYMVDSYLQSQDQDQLDRIIILLNLAENLAKATFFVSEESNETYRSIAETLETMRELALRKSGIGPMFSAPEGWDLEAN